MTNEKCIELIDLLKKFIGYDKENPFVQETQEALSMSIQALVTKGQSIWIPCSMKLPEEYTDCLITQKITKLDGSSYYSVEKTLFYNGVFDTDIIAPKREVLAWMPLPEPYKDNN